MHMAEGKVVMVWRGWTRVPVHGGEKRGRAWGVQTSSLYGLNGLPIACLDG